jgi:iron(III) transport system permease protein
MFLKPSRLAVHYPPMVTPRTRLHLGGLAALLAMASLLLLAADPRQAILLRNTLWLAAGAAAIGLPAGALLALLIVRTDMPGRTAVAVVLGVMLLVPLYLQATAWDAGFGSLGWYSVTRDAIATPWLSGWRAAIWIHGVAAVPWVTLLLGAGLRWIEPELEEQAWLDASLPAVLWHVTLPRMWPALGVAAIWVFLSTAAEMTVTDLYRVRTYAEELYTGFALGDEGLTVLRTMLPGVLAQAALILVVCLVTLSIAGPLRAAERPALTIRLRRWRAPALTLVIGLLVVIAAVPLGNLVFQAGAVTAAGDPAPLRSWSAAKLCEVVARAGQQSRAEFQWTLAISGLAATLAVVVGAVLSWLARHGGRRAWPAVAVTAVGLATPGPLLGLTVIWLLDRPQPPGLVWLYDRTVAAPVLAILVRVLPLANLVCWTAWRAIPDQLLDQAACDGAGPWSRFWHIAVPLGWPTLSVAWLAAFAAGAGDLAASILVVPPGMTTVPIRVFGLVHAGVEQQVAGICLLAAAGYLLVAGAIVAVVAASRTAIARQIVQAPAAARAHARLFRLRKRSG